VSLATNLNKIDLSAQQETPEYFSNLYDTIVTISSEQNDYVMSFFENLTGDKAAAEILASGVIYTAARRDLDIIAAITEFQTLEPRQINRALAMFLNTQRYGTSYLGLNTSAEVSPYTLRAIRF